MLDFQPLSKAVHTLAQALAVTDKHAPDLLARDGCIQRFEYTYELCVKSMRRQLENMADSPSGVDELGFKDMIRLAAERGLLDNPQAWFGYRELRNITAHAYDPDKAMQVFSALPQFLQDAQTLAQRLQA